MKKLDTPTCCGKTMKIKVEAATYYEVTCKECGDTVYIKKQSAPKPTMLDD